jgi:DNA polymerase-3 subunit alpha
MEGGWKKEVLDYAQRLEGTIRNHGVHACGVVIAPDDLVNYVPLEMAQKGVVATQFPMGQVEDMGLLKMDFLGLSNLSIISNCIRIVKKVYGDVVKPDEIPLDDPKMFELFQRADTTGVFQLESAGMKRYLKELHATKFEDIIAMVALYRPGPMSEIPKFIARKNGKEPVTYYEDHMENALKNTYGILVYQEQFMQISKEVCGFTGGEADTLRKAVGKKKIDLMKTMKPKLIEGGVKCSGADRGKMEKFWDHLEAFANYCFNKSHAACYALVACWTAYLKAHYPEAFMAALMTADHDNTDRLAIEIAECNKMGIKVLAPDINESFEDFAVVPETKNIRFGLGGVKGVGGTAIEAIIEARKTGGKFESIEDYCRRVNSRVSNKKVWESLIKTGAWDEFGDRSDLLFSLEAILEFAQKVQKEAASGQVDLFGMMDADEVADGALSTVKISPAPTKYSDKEQLMRERELLGLYISGHPLDKYADYLREKGEPLAGIKPERDSELATVCGIVDSVRVINTKKGDKMAFVKIADKSGELELIVFPRTYTEVADGLVQDAFVRIQGKISGTDRDGHLESEAKIIVENVHFVSDEENNAYEATGEPYSRDNDAFIASGGSGGGKRGFGRSGGGSTGGFGAGKFGSRVAEPKPKYKNEPMSVNPRDIVIKGPVTNKDAGLPRAEGARNDGDNKVTREQAKQSGKIYINVLNPTDTTKLMKAKSALETAPGEAEVILVLGGDRSNAMRMPFKSEPSDGLRAELTKIYGEENVKFK